MAATGRILQGLLMNHAPVKSCSLLFLSSVAWVLCGTGCSTTSPAPVQGTGSDNVSYWDGDRMDGAPSVRISLSEQRAYLYKGGQLAGVSLISSGREGLATVTGEYRITEKEKTHQSSLFGNYVNSNGEVIQRDVDTRTDSKPVGAFYEGADMPHWMRITGGTGMHEGFLPGYADSHGCIRMPGFMAEAFYRTVAVGTPVSIQH